MTQEKSETILGTVRFDAASAAQVAWGSGNRDPREAGLKEGESYDVVEIEVHSWHTKIRLAGVQGKFNSASFTWFDEAPLNAAVAAWRRALTSGSM